MVDAQSVSPLRETAALSVHGPAGVLDLLVPIGATVADISTEYAVQARLPAPPRYLCTKTGIPLDLNSSLTEAGLDTGAIVVAVDHFPSAAGARGKDSSSMSWSAQVGPLSALWFSLAAAAAALAGWYAAHLPDDDTRSFTIGLLIGAVGVGVLPLGAFAAHRVLVAPVFGAAAAFALAYGPEPEMMPTILGVSALAAAVVAAIARALDEQSEEGLRVWMAVGATVFVLTAGCALLDVGSQVVWAILLALAMTAARFVPGLAIDVPDQYLIDLERLAVTAWSARERPTGRRTRTIVPAAAVATVATRGARMVTAACVAILAIVVVSAPMLLSSTAAFEMDRIGARVMVGFAGAALLLAARSYRHTAARSLLRVSGLWCWLCTTVVIFGLVDAGTETMIAFVSIAIAGLLIWISISLGRGWRSAWWSRQAEVAEGVAGAFALGSLVVATGLFQQLWELTS